MRILHLIDPASPGGGACTLRLLADVVTQIDDVRHDVVVLGTRAHVMLARRCGLSVTGLLCPPLAKPLLARRALVRALVERERRLGRYDVMHAWTLPSAALLARAVPTRRRLVTLTVGPVASSVSRLEIAAALRRPAPILAISTGVAQECVALGLPAHAVRVLAPGIASGRDESDAPSPDRAALRERWGVDDETFVVAALSEPSSWADAYAAIAIAVRIDATGRPLRFVVHHGAARRAAAERWARTARGRRLLITDDAVAEPWRILPGLDAVLAIGGVRNAQDLRAAGAQRGVSRPALFGGDRHALPMPGVLPLLGAMQAGVPVVAESSCATREVLGSNGAGVLVEQHDTNGICAHLSALCDDRATARRIGAQGRARVAEAYGVEAFRDRLRREYG